MGHEKLRDKIDRLKSQRTTGEAVSEDMKFVAVVCKSPAKRAKAAWRSEDFSGTPFKTTFLALLAERDEFKSRY